MYSDKILVDFNVATHLERKFSSGVYILEQFQIPKLCEAAKI
jgi:hypothetical protein